ncbi:MAG: alpha/beta hydrolase [Sandaracinaceae bacterium]
MRPEVLILSLLLLACGGEPAPPRLAETVAPAPAGPVRPLEVHWVGEPTGDGPLLVLLHGYGAPGDDLVPFGESLRAQHPGLRVALPEAPLPRPPSGRAWWPVDLARDRPADRSTETPPGMAEARRDVVAWLTSLHTSGQLDPDRTVIGGFSQGAMLSLDVALTLRFPLAGVATLSGGPVDHARWQARMQSRPPARVFVSHGRSDPLLSFEAARALQEELASEGAQVRWLPFDGGHSIPAPVRAGLAAWLAEAL